MAVLNQNLNRAFDLFELKPANEIGFLRLPRVLRPQDHHSVNPE